MHTFQISKKEKHIITIDTLIQSIISQFTICLARILLFQCISHSSCDENVVYSQVLGVKFDFFVQIVDRI